MVFSLGGLMVSQVNQLATDLPQYQSTLREKIEIPTAGAGTDGRPHTNHYAVQAQRFGFTNPSGAAMQSRAIGS
jgi:hypothetical protein